MNDHEALLRKWARRHGNRDFISDGVIDPARWNTAPRRVLFLLREAYGGSFDLRAYVRAEGGPTGHTFQRAALWAFILHHATRTHLPPLEDPPLDEKLIADAFLSSAVVNIKKSNGQKRSDFDDLKRCAQKDRALLLRQIDLIDPEIIVSGNVWGAVGESLFSDAIRAHDLVLKWRGRWIIDFWHPGNQFPRLINYHAFASVVQNAGVLGGAV